MASARGDLGEGGARERWGEKADGGERMHHHHTQQGGTRAGD